jgi:hypothetical protein
MRHVWAHAAPKLESVRPVPATEQRALGCVACSSTQRYLGFGENTDTEMCFDFATPYPNGLRPARSSA